MTKHNKTFLSQPVQIDIHCTNRKVVGEVALAASIFVQFLGFEKKVMLPKWLNNPPPLSLSHTHTHTFECVETLCLLFQVMYLIWGFECLSQQQPFARTINNEDSLEMWRHTFFGGNSFHFTWRHNSNYVGVESFSFIDVPTFERVIFLVHTYLRALFSSSPL